MNLQSLEADRQAILERMRLRRENYRRMLTDGDQLGEVPVGQAVRVDHGVARGYTPALRPVAANQPPPDVFPRSTIVRTVMQHPLVVVLGVAAIIAIGPKRIIRLATTGGSALATLTVRNQSNADLVERLITMAGAYLQGQKHSQP